MHKPKHSLPAGPAGRVLQRLADLAGQDHQSKAHPARRFKPASSSMRSGFSPMRTRHLAMVVKQAEPDERCQSATVWVSAG